MPEVNVIIYCEEDGTAPLIEWLETLQVKAAQRCYKAIERLEEKGHELRRPHADLLEDGIWELRIKYFRLNLRILYFFHGQEAVVLTNGLTKEKEVPPKEIALAKTRREVFLANPDLHTHQEED